LAGAGAAAVAGLTAAACSGSDVVEQASPDRAEDAVTPASVATAIGPDANTDSGPDLEPASVETSRGPVEFVGDHQRGVLLDPARAGLVATFDVIDTSVVDLAQTLQMVSAEIQRLMAGGQAPAGDEFLPPADSGAIGAETTTSGISITVAVGATLFDERFGLADHRPRELIPMPTFFNDRLVRPELSHGDLSVTITAPNPQAGVFALHQLVRVSDRRLRLRWVQEGYNQLLPEEAGAVAHSRNLMGFRDGTSNLDTSSSEQMNEFVWVQASDDEPDWATGGTYQAARIIRMLIEFWATAALVRQEQIFGRHRDTGAPLGQEEEGEQPSFVANPSDDTIPRRAHIRLANPRTPGSARILRRGFSYLNGVSGDGTMDQGLLFLCYQRSLTRGFLEVQSRLDGEPLEDYIKPVGGGLFFVLPGPTNDGWLGQSLIEA